MPTTLTNGIQLPDKGSVDWYGSMQSNYNLIDTHLGNTDIHVTAEDKANWNSKQGSLSQAQLDAIAQVATNTSDIASLQSGKADASHTHSSSDITDIGDYATKQYVDNSISGLVDSAPNALDTLNELAAALNDDANFATTVTTALSAKANSADLATVATSGSYNDLSNKPTINDSTITIQKNGSLVGTFTVNGSAKTIDIPVPTKTSDLTNDSNFVDTSNSAVASGITSAKVTAYDAHIADTTIHVTTADKTKWNNGVSQSYVLRYSSSSVTDNSTIAYSTLDNTDNIKSGDKVIDVDGKIFSVVSVDTTNQTVTVGTALIDLAQDSDVVHKSGDETIGGRKTFSENITCSSNSDAKSIICKTPLSTYDSTNTVGDNTKIRFLDKNNNSISYIMQRKLTNGSTNISLNISNTDSNNQPIEATLTFVLDSANEPRLSPGIDNTISIGRPTFRYKSFYGMNYYYGSNNIEFSTKFVTTDTNQTISGGKTFSNTIKSLKEIEFTGNRLAYILPEFSASYSGLILCTYGSSGAVKIGNWKVDDNDNTKHVLDTSLGYLNITTGSVNSVNSVYLTPRNTTNSKLGDSTNKWTEINGLTPSSLSLPSDRSARIDISSYFTNTGDNEDNEYVASANGYIYLDLGNVSSVFCSSHSNNYPNYKTNNYSGANNVNQLLFPITKGNTAKFTWRTNSTVTIFSAYFIPCQGNV